MFWGRIFRFFHTLRFPWCYIHNKELSYLSLRENYQGTLRCCLVYSLSPLTHPAYPPLITPLSYCTREGGLPLVRHFVRNLARHLGVAPSRVQYPGGPQLLKFLWVVPSPR